MPTTITKFKIFLASPSDLSEERISIDEVINELNLTYGKLNDIHLELLKWETHSAPAISEESPQEIINSDIGNDYDLFIGLIWKKFGSPTNRAESGTEEEFLNAYNRFIESPNSLQILFYFNTQPISINEIEPEQIQKIQRFKSDLGKNKNVLYFEYQEPQQLYKFLRIHIPQRISDLQKISIEKTEEVNIKEDTSPIEIPDEYGLIDYQEIIEESFQESTESIGRISNATTWIGEQLNKKTEEIQGLTLNGNQPGRKTLKDFFNRTSKIMDNYANRIEPEIPIFYENFEKGIDAFSNIVNIQKNDFTFDENDIEESHNSLIKLIDGIEASIKGMEGFLDSVINLPRMSKELNKAKSNVATKLNNLLDNLRISLSIAIELEKTISK